MQANEPNDPYIWLEDVEGERSLGWATEASERTLTHLQTRSDFQKLQAEALEVLTSDDRIAYATFRGDRAYNFWQDKDNPKGLWRRSPVKAYLDGEPEWETVLDIDKLAEDEGVSWVFNGSVCLPGEEDRCILRLSDGGKDAVHLREFSLKTKTFIDDGFVAPEGKQWFAWVDADTVFIARDWGEGTLTKSGYPNTVKFWRRGEALSDAQTVYEGAVEDVFVFPVAHHTPDGVTLLVSRGETFFEFSTYLVDRDTGETTALPLPRKLDIAGVFEGALIVKPNELWSHGGADVPAGAVVALDLSAVDAAPEVIYAPGPRDAVTDVEVSRDRLVIAATENVIGRLYQAKRKRRGWDLDRVDLPDGGSVRIAEADPFDKRTLLLFEGYDQPETLFVHGGRGDPDVVQALPAMFDAKGVDVEQRMATSADGTEIPYFVVGRDLAAAGPRPTLLYGYGGFEIPILPNYSPVVGRLWLERGGIYVVANIRGGGEFGPEWHQAALKLNRQRAYDDFIAVAQDLINGGVASPATLGVMGGSNGGLLTGNMLVQAPELINAAVIEVPLLDMIRYVDLPPGASWAAEYGHPSNPEERANLLKISPYHNVDAAADYPIPLFFTNTHDDRVHPGHARKMAKKMLDQGHAMYFYEETEGGHGRAADPIIRAKVRAIEFSYLAERLMDGGEG